MTAATTFFDELVDSLRRVPLGRLPEVAAVIRGLSAPAKGPRADLAGAFAKSILESSTPGSKLEEAQRAIVAHALMETQGNVSAAARLLGVERKALERKVRKYRLR